MFHTEIDHEETYDSLLNRKERILTVDISANKFLLSALQAAGDSEDPTKTRRYLQRRGAYKSSRRQLYMGR